MHIMCDLLFLLLQFHTSHLWFYKRLLATGSAAPSGVSCSNPHSCIFIIITLFCLAPANLSCRHFIWSELQVIMWRVCVAKKHMGPAHESEELAMFQCHSCPRRINPHKATLPTLGFDWQPLGDTETASLSAESSSSSIQETHKHRYFSVFFLFEWSETST